MEREYVVVVNPGVDLETVDKELAASTGSYAIPRRSVDIANPRIGSKRMTHWMLTEEEARKLELDPRILSVEIPVDQRTDIKIGKLAFQEANFTKPITLDNNLVNWGLRRCIEEENAYGNGLTASDRYEYALDGTGVDIVIQDSGLQVDHPEFTDSFGNSRVKQINWFTESGISGTQHPNFYRDTDGHGTHCAGIAAAKTYGWAKNANIYAQKLSGLEGTNDAGTGISVANAFDTIRLWHNSKNNSRPTVVNMSWGYFTEVTGSPTSGVYRGTPWNYVDFANDVVLWQAVGLVPLVTATSRFLPARVASVDAEIEDMISAGIHITIAAGNDYYKADVIGGDDYNNTVIYGALTYNYHRGSSPYSDNALIVGNSDDNPQESNGVYLEKTANTTTRGPSVDIFAPGTNIVSTCSTSSIYTTADYIPNSNFKVAMINGTSMAAPQVAGVAAQYLQAQPNLTPAQLKAKIEGDSKAYMFSTGLDNDYAAFGTSLMGGPNRFLYSKYGRQPSRFSGVRLGSLGLINT